MFRKIVGIFLAAAVLLSCCGNLALAEQPTRITWYGVGGGSDHDARINETATKRLQELGFNVEFEYIEMGWGDYLQNYQIMLSAQEPFDLFNAQGNNVMQFAKNGGIVEITDEMMDTLLPDVKKVAPAHVVEGLKMEGKTYMVPSMHEWAQYYGFSALNLGIMETLDLDMSGIRSLDDLDPIFEKVHAAFPDVYCTRQADLKEITMMLYGIGPANHTDTFPISIKALEEDQDFFSTFENEDVIKVLRKWNEWYQKGYIVPLEDSNNFVAMRAEGKIFCGMGRFKPGSGAQTSNAVVRYTDMRWNEEVPPIMSMKDAPAGWVTALSKTSKNPELALQVLNQFYSDPVLVTLLSMGEEGIDYTVAEDGFVDFIDGGFANAMFANRNWQIGNSALLPVSRGYADLGLTDIWKQLEEFNNSAVPVQSAGFYFDVTDVDIEAAAIANVCDQYLNVLVHGAAEDFEGTLNQFVEKLYDNGLQTLLDECNRQYDEFLANK